MLKLKSAGKYADALAYAIHQAEADELKTLHKKYGSAGGNCFTACLGGALPPPVRTPEFIKAIQNYDWPEAARLVTTPEEKQDLDDSIARVDQMLKLKAEGMYDDALSWRSSRRRRRTSPTPARAAPPRCRQGGSVSSQDSSRV